MYSGTMKYIGYFTGICLTTCNITYRREISLADVKYHYQREKSDIAPPLCAMVLIIGERAKRARHSQVCSIENRAYIRLTSTECKTLKGELRMIFIYNINTALNYNQERGIFCPCGKDALSTCINNKIIQHSFFFHFHIGLLYRCHYAALYVLAASNQVGVRVYIYTVEPLLSGRSGTKGCP